MALRPQRIGRPCWLVQAGTFCVDARQGHMAPEPGAARPGVRRGMASGLPPSRARPRLDVMPWWVWVWYALPLLDRYAHAWMWANGGWEVCPPPGGSPVEHTGGREPRDPLLPGRQSGAALAIPQTDQQPH